MEIYLGSAASPKMHRIDPSSFLAKGGMGSAYLINPQTVLKIYHQPNYYQIQKIADLLQLLVKLKASGKSIPREVIFPQEMAYDKSGQVVGFTMPYLDKHFQPMWQLIQPNYRQINRITPAIVAKIFLNGIPVIQTLHSLGILIGDHNYRNTYHQLANFAWMLIDSDSFAFGQYGSEGTDLFLAPELFGKDLTMPIFKSGHDYYSFATMLFMSLTLVHPYGGFHKQYRTIQKRAQKQISVFDASVVYPDDALPLKEVLTPELSQQFKYYFEDGKRDMFPAETLIEYIQFKEGKKPMYAPAYQAPKVEIGDATSIFVLLQTQGGILFSTVRNNILYLIADESDQITYYQADIASSYSGKAMIQKIALPNFMTGSRFGLLQGTDSQGIHSQFLVVNPPFSETLDIYQISNTSITKTTSLKTGVFLGNKQAMFRTSLNHVVVMIANDIFACKIEDGTLRRYPVRTFRQQQTWFSVDQSSEQPRMVVLYYTFDEPHFHYIEGSSAYAMPIPSLNPQEALLDLSIKFASTSCMLMLLTEEKGEEYLHLYIMDSQGKVRFAQPRVKRSEHFFTSIHGHTHATTIDTQENNQHVDLVLHPTNEGICQSRLQQQRLKKIPNTQKHITEQSTLYPFRIPSLGKAGIIAVKGNTVLRLG